MSFAFRITISLLSLLLCSTIGILQLTSQHINSGIFCLSMAALNLLPMWLNWKAHKAQQESANDLSL